MFASFDTATEKFNSVMSILFVSHIKAILLVAQSFTFRPISRKTSAAIV